MGKKKNTPKKKDKQQNIEDQNAFAILAEKPCRICREEVPKADGLQCNRCKGWVHGAKSCSELSKAQFKFMFQQSDIPAIQYICLSCRKDESDKVDPRDVVVRDAVAQNAAKLEVVGHYVDLLQQQSRTIMDYMKTSSKTDSSIRLHVTEAISDQKDREDRKNNIILYNIPECDAKATAGVVEAETIQNVKNVFNYVEPGVDTTGLNGKNVIRLGKPRTPSEEYPNPRPRPIKVILRNPQEVSLLRNNARKLKDNNGLNHVGISADKTWKEREEEREVRQEYNKRKHEDKEDVIIYNNKVILRSQRPNEIVPKARVVVQEEGESE